jgi:uncharacterized phage protein (TIGR01671 family)
MREIKFRAWINDGEYSRMVTSDQAVFTALRHCYNKTGIGEGTTGYHYVDNSPKPDKYILMQYTGLKDKNGVEIYEGDVVRGRQTFTTAPTTPSEVVAVVEYSERNTSCLSLGGSIYQYEVIGNIYENPELLKESGASE